MNLQQTPRRTMLPLVSGDGTRRRRLGSGDPVRAAPRSRQPEGLGISYASDTLSLLAVIGGEVRVNTERKPRPSKKPPRTQAPARPIIKYISSNFGSSSNLGRTKVSGW